ncbi:hypothetical protein LTS08_005618 [Lithohypha guttulata]|uniref:uncharacterized protein n=1 Tax=Lithohypha guttulata TaxID=1690604 RepID=UPI002DDF2B8D|nr:hypothetical protein LTR51_003211 [Lithohypha guttulata]KAK5099903.1 hypothetical protein LTS08_005618 [Lithohypha guttulata]
MSTKKSTRHANQLRKKTQSNTDQKPRQTVSCDQDASNEQPVLPIEVQQIVLNVFRTAFPTSQDTEELKTIIREVKRHLFNRDFSAAFSSQSFLQAYALRWSAARALGYTELLTNARTKYLFDSSETDNGHLEPDTQTTTSQSLDSPNHHHRPANRVVCIGGGAGAEIVALAASNRTSSKPLQVVAIDSADWSDPVQKLASALTVPPTLSIYASEAFRKRPENQPLVVHPMQVDVSFMHQDVLSWSRDSLRESLSGTTLCTIMFTLNELFSTSIPKTTAFLLDLTSAMPQGSHLLVVDSPGSYSEVQLGKKSVPTNTAAANSEGTKRYPMKWLLDHTLLVVAKGESEAVWVKVENEDSLWFRIEQKDREKLEYPVELENMRYQLHSYRRI